MKVGSLVRLKSGSPVMVVKGEITKDRVKCKWFNGEKMCKEDFPVDALTLVDKKGAPIDHDVIEKTVSLKVDVSEIDKGLFGDFMSVEVEALTLAKWRSNPAVWLEERFGEKPDMLYWDSLEKNRDHFRGDSRNPFLKGWNIIASGDHENWCGLKADSKWHSSANGFIARVIFWFLDCYPDDSHCHVFTSNEVNATLLWEDIKKTYPAFKKIRPASSLNDERKVIKLDVECNQKNRLELDSLVSLKEKKMAGLHATNMLLIMDNAHELPDHTMKAIVGTSNGINHMILAVGDSGKEGNTLENFVKNYDKAKLVTSQYQSYPILIKHYESEPSPSLNWIKIDKDNLPPQDAWVLCSDGKEWKKAYVTNQFSSL